MQTANTSPSENPTRTFSFFASVRLTIHDGADNDVMVTLCILEKLMNLVMVKFYQDTRKVK